MILTDEEIINLYKAKINSFKVVQSHLEANVRLRELKTRWGDCRPGALDRAEAKLLLLTNACKKIASGMTTDMLGPCSLGREDMQDIAQAAIAGLDDVLARGQKNEA